MCLDARQSQSVNYGHGLRRDHLSPITRSTMILLWAYVFLVVPSSFAALHPSSPCPSIFSYEGSQPERERWYGIVLLNTDESLVGVRLDLKLDRPAEILVSWMGTVTTEDNEHFTVLSLDQKLHPGPPLPSRFMVKFNAVKGSPQVRTIRLNGRQICPPDPNFASDVQPSNQDNLYENRYTTERVTRRPDLDFDNDWTNSRPGNPPRSPVTESHKPPRRQSPGGYSGGEEYNSHESPHGAGYSGSPEKHTIGGSVSHGDKEAVRTTTYGYDSHETYHGDKNRRPSVAGSNTRPNPRPLGTDNTQYNNPSRPSISININKDVTYNVDRPETLSYNGDTGSMNRPTDDRDRPTNTNSHQQPQRSTESSTVGGSRGETYGKTTTKKPVVVHSINININSRDEENPSSGSSYNPSKATTRRPYVNNNKTSSSNNHQTTQRPVTSDNQRPSGNNGYPSTRPNRNPDVTSSESHRQPGYGQNGYDNSEKTTERNYQSNHKSTNTEYTDNEHPSPVPSSRPSSGGGNHLQRPQGPTGPKRGEDGNLEVSNTRVKCGQVEVNPAPLITHGQNTARGQWPWHIALYRIEGINLSYSCGGSLVSSTVVITAAHCVTKAPRDRPVDADILVVQLGKYHLYQFSDDSVQNKQVRDIHVHPSYNSTNYLDDLAVLVLSSPAEFTKYVRPVCLWPRHNFNLQSIDNKEGTVVGWGYDENNQVTEELKMARMPVVSYVTCLKSYPQFFSQFTAENKTFCAGFRQGTSVCNGDSGGGMVFQQDNVWYLRGLVSITVAKQGLRVCDTNHYVVFTDVANYVDWIIQYVT